MADDDVLPPDVRDETLARALEVEPLDELTRRRLVSGALSAAADATDEAAPPAEGTARARVLGIAAAAVAFVVLGVAALTLPGGDSVDVASRAPRPKSERASQQPATAAGGTAGSTLAPTAVPQSNTAAADATGSSARAPAPIHGVATLGDLGELSTTGTRSRVLAAAQPVAADHQPTSRLVSFQGCPERGITAVAAGVGTLDGAPALVVVSRRADGTLQVRALDSATCTLRSLP